MHWQHHFSSAAVLALLRRCCETLARTNSWKQDESWHEMHHGLGTDIDVTAQKDCVQLCMNAHLVCLAVLSDLWVGAAGGADQ